MNYKGQLLTKWIIDSEGVQRPEVTANHRLKNVSQSVVKNGKEVVAGNICTCDFECTTEQLTLLRADPKIMVVEAYEDTDDSRAKKPMNPVPREVETYLVANGVDIASASVAVRSKHVDACIEICKRIARKEPIPESGITEVKPNARTKEER